LIFTVRSYFTEFNLTEAVVKQLFLKATTTNKKTNNNKYIHIYNKHPQDVIVIIKEGMTTANNKEDIKDLHPLVLQLINAEQVKKF
jgi:hypothetical protein